MSLFRRKERQVPGLNTASLPDLIFTVLFFFMIVTHMRQTEMKVQYQVPQGTELEKLTRKSTVTYIYIGRPAPQYEEALGSATQIQLNDKLSSPADVANFVASERAHIAPEDQQKMTVSIKADRQTPMGIVTEVKQALRRAGALKINYSATKEGKE